MSVSAQKVPIFVGVSHVKWVWLYLPLIAENMAAKRIRLPSLKVTKRPAYGKKALKYLERTVDYDSVGVPNESVENDFPDISTTGENILPSTSSEPTCYLLESKASTAGWATIRGSIEKAIVERAVLPQLQTCLNCPDPASIRCKRCGPKSYFCEKCFFLIYTGK